MPVTSAQPCPDVEAVFARGTGEPPGVGGIGEPFVDALRAAVGPKSLDVYPVNYEASSNFSDRIEFAQSVVDGIKDASSHIEATAANCPKTRIVLGGYSQGAAVAGFVTSASVPAGSACGVRAVPAQADAAGDCQPRRRGHALRETVGAVAAELRRAGDRHRPAVRAEDHRAVR